MPVNSMRMFGNRLKEIRLEKGLTQSDIATLLSISLRQYQRYEKGDSDIPLSTAVSLAKIFDVSLDYLVGRSNSK